MLLALAQQGGVSTLAPVCDEAVDDQTGDGMAEQGKTTIRLAFAVPLALGTLFVLLAVSMPAQANTLTPSAASAAAVRPSKLSIVPGKSIAGVKLGDSEARVENVLGKPASTTTSHGSTLWDYSKQFLKGTLYFKHSEMEGIETFSKREKTNKGIGPGSSLAATQRKYPSAKCESPSFDPDGLMCVIAGKHDGHKVKTSFLFASPKKPMGAVELEVK
jgi:hypothetical protein